MVAGWRGWGSPIWGGEGGSPPPSILTPRGDFGGFKIVIFYIVSSPTRRYLPSRSADDGKRREVSLDTNGVAVVLTSAGWLLR